MRKKCYLRSQWFTRSVLRAVSVQCGAVMYRFLLPIESSQMTAREKLYADMYVDTRAGVQ